MVKKNTIYIIAGIILLLIAYNGALSREAAPQFDGTISDFSLSLTSKDSVAKVGDLYHVKVLVKNDDTQQAGRMYVQCSILNGEDYPWLSGVASRGSFNVVNNCHEPEPFTQTAQISLSAGVGGNFQFAFKVPDSVDKTNYVYCSAYEQCSSDTIEDGYESDSFKQAITITKSTSSTTGTSGSTINDKGDMCSDSNKCDGWLWGTKCVNGHCVDKEDMPDNSDFKFPTTGDIKEWIGKYKIALIITGIILLIIGVFVVFREPKVEF